MSEWTPEARRGMEDYLQEVAILAKARELDADELTGELRAHIESEIREVAGAVVSLDHVEAVLARMGAPEQVLPPEGEDPVKMDRLNQMRRFLATDNQQRAAKKEFPWGVSAWLFGITLPIVALGFEVCFGLMANLYLDPIPTIWHFLALSVIPITIGSSIVSTRRAFAGKPLNPKLGAALGFSVALSCAYMIIYIPTMPISAIGLMGGIGAMGFAPLACFIISLHYSRLGMRFMIEDGPLNAYTYRRFRWYGAIAAILFMVLGEGSSVIRREVLFAAISNNPETRALGVTWARRLHYEDIVLDGCYRFLGMRRDSLFASLTGNDRYPDDRECRDLYWRMTGEPYNSQPRPVRYRPTGARGVPWGDDGSAWLSDRETGGMKAGILIPTLYLSSSALDINAMGQSRENPAPLTSYTEWTLEFENRDTRQSHEARALIQLPPDAVASRLTLWINGEEREAAFGGRQQVTEAYQEVAVVQRRDPALLRSAGPDQVFLQCFPILAKGKMKVKIGITAPVRMRDGKAFITLPRIVERDFNLADGLSHSVWAESTVPLSYADETLVSAPGRNQTYALKGGILDNSLIDGVIGLENPPPLDTQITDMLGSSSDPAHQLTASLTVSRRPPPAPSKVCIVVDGSISTKKADIDWTKFVGSLPAGCQVMVIHAGGGATAWQDNFTAPLPSLAEWLMKQKYAGGCDNSDSLIKGLESLAGDGVLLWMHGPQPGDPDFTTDALDRLAARTDISRIKFLDFTLRQGPNQIREMIGDRLGMVSIPMVTGVNESLQYVARTLGADDLVYTFTEPVISAPGAPAAPALLDPGHIVRLAVARLAASASLMNGGAEAKTIATQMAARARVITPMTAAVVLESKEQYERNELNPDSFTDAVPVVPEPETWAFLILVSLVLCWQGRVMYKKKRLGSR